MRFFAGVEPDEILFGSRSDIEKGVFERTRYLKADWIIDYRT